MCKNTSAVSSAFVGALPSALLLKSYHFLHLFTTFYHVFPFVKIMNTLLIGGLRGLAKNTHNQGVDGSSPSGPTQWEKPFKKLKGFFCIFNPMKYFCYILYSEKLNRYYIGETSNLEERQHLHNTAFFKGCYTSRTNDWHVKISIVCNSRTESRRIENHIKSMKSKKYIENLITYPEMILKLQDRFKEI